ncbi:MULTISPECIES: transcriptional regulator, SarA/Rot family [Bacillaceae]|uniref:MarR family transcriptional regulator n=1 Tax=Evansella alkalicola TaxID=745819 RepID=A0ABS6K229_9BACI|nr:MULTISPECIES: MarR family transcriptional regulator [Bacillaceae]MBU9724079.1 MarR family transcriptional regulator [Bacillus alkalicola]
MAVDDQSVLLINYMRGLGKVLEDEWQSNAQNIGLTLAEQHVLWIVYTKEKVSVTDVAKIGLWDRSTVMQIMKRLQQKQLVEIVKDVSDLRVTYITLTEEGKKKREESEHKDYKLFDFINKYKQENPEGLEEVVQFHRRVNEHFHGSEFVDWVEETKQKFEK